MFDGAHPGELIETAPPRVTLRNAFAHPFDSAIAAARTCYAPRLIGPEEITDKQRLNIGAATFYSGHHTVYQHAHFEFGLEANSSGPSSTLIPSTIPSSKASATSAWTARKPMSLPSISTSTSNAAKSTNKPSLAPGTTIASFPPSSSVTRALS